MTFTTKLVNFFMLCMYLTLFAILLWFSIDIVDSYMVGLPRGLYSNVNATLPTIWALCTLLFGCAIAVTIELLLLTNKLNTRGK